MKIIHIGYDQFQKKDIIKLEYRPDEHPHLQLFRKGDVIAGNPLSNIAIAFIYTWKEDKPPKEILEFFNQVSNYAAITGFWKTTNGARYVFANILSNPNINKLLVFVFDQKDNGHRLVDALTNFWKNGISKEGIIIGSKAGNPKFEGLPIDALATIKDQCDLLIMPSIMPEGFEQAENLVSSLYQEPENAKDLNDFPGVELYSTHEDIAKNMKLYDDGARFNEPYIVNLTSSSEKPIFTKKEIAKVLGQSVQAENLEDALLIIAAFVYEHGEWTKDQRGITTVESRSFTIIIMDPLAKIPEGFSDEYLKKYVDEFLNGKSEGKDEFAYTYHERIFKHWGNQVEHMVETLKKNPNTRRAMISLWDQNIDIGNSNPPCLDFIWAVIRDSKLEFHVVYRSHHLATISKDGRLMKGEGAFVPNLYAIATLQEDMAKKLGLKRGPIALTDFSGHLYVSEV
jgi:thymidylate synthase/tetrahydromethanopterin S-methyltransferase subunit A